MSKASDFYRGINDAITTAVARLSPFRARVHAVVDGKVQIQPYDGSDPLAEPYARLAGFALDPDDEAVTIYLNGKPVVLGRLQRATPTGERFDQPITVKTTSALALDVQRETGETVFEVDTDQITRANFREGAILSGYDDTSSNTWSINSASGNVAAGNVTGRSFNSPFVATNTAQESATSSTTSTSTYVTALSTTINLPLGTWSVHIHASIWARHSGDGAGRYLVRCGGVESASITPTTYATSYANVTMDHRFLGMSGSLDVDIQYRSSTTGTTVTKNPSLFIVATRTS